MTATEKVIEKAAEMGMAVGVSRKHNHFGAAGIYTRMMLEHDLICFSTSGHQLKLEPGDPLIRARWWVAHVLCDTDGDGTSIRTGVWCHSRVL